MAKLYGDLTGEKIDKLKIIKRTDDIMSASGKSKYIAWLCKCDCGNEIVVKNDTLKKQTHFLKSCGCSKEINPNYKKTHMTPQDIQEWEELYDYVNNQIMGYDKNSLSYKMILRLRGMKEGKFLQNKKIKKRANYSYKIILMTFKYSSTEIKRVINNKEFFTEELKFNYICAIVESNLNTVYQRIENAKKSKVKTQEIVDELNSSLLSHTGAKYQTKVQNLSNKRLEKLW